MIIKIWFMILPLELKPSFLLLAPYSNIGDDPQKQTDTHHVCTNEQKWAWLIYLFPNLMVRWAEGRG